MSEPPLVSVVLPIFNESNTIREIIDRVQKSLGEYDLEVVLVDDGSTDGTPEKLRMLPTSENLRVFGHPKNMGKGAALRTAFEHVRGSIVVIQDADLEYDPRDIPRLIQPIVDGLADVVYGSRFRGESQRVHLFWHRIANALLTLLSNMLTNLNLSDMETGYKAFRLEVVKKLQLRENRFGIEPEMTAKVARLGCRVYEVPISYHGRDYAAGKKIGFKDAVRAVWCIVRYRLSN